jgi:hypothetical protein
VTPLVPHEILAPMAEIQTKPTTASPEAFIESVAHAGRRADSRVLLEMMTRVSGRPATMSGPAIIGFGTRKYALAGGKSGDMLRMGFSPRKAYMALYIKKDFDEARALIGRMGKADASTSCTYINKLADVDPVVLEELLALSWARTAETQPA